MTNFWSINVKAFEIEEGAGFKVARSVVTGTWKGSRIGCDRK